MSLNIGPTVVSFAESRLDWIEREIRVLQEERQMLLLRIKKYKNSTMGEAERRATAAEPFQKTQLPES